jgi:5-methylcytosine-specific restriction endonuclease McrA
MGKCAATGRKLSVDEIHCHHKKPKRLGGDDSYANLTIISADVHKLVHAVNTDTINRLLKALQLTEYQMRRVNGLRSLCESDEITMSL